MRTTITAPNENAALLEQLLQRHDFQPSAIRERDFHTSFTFAGLNEEEVQEVLNLEISK